MSIRLRPMGKPCLRSPRGALMAVAGVVALTTAPATAAFADHVKPLGWYAEEAAVPATVQFQDVASDGATTLAVGRDGDAETGTAVIYRRAGDAWQADTLSAELTSPSVITDVAVSGSQEWAVGTSNGAPVVLQRVNGVWLTPAQGEEPITATPVSVDVRGATALVGDADGKVHFFTAGVHSPEDAIGAGPVNGVAVTGAATGVAVAGFDPFPLFGDNSVRIYSLTEGGKPVPEHDATASTAGVSMTGMASASNGAAVALDDTEATWHRADDGDWVQDAPVSADGLTDVSSLANGVSNVREELAGSVGTEGAIWQRDRYKGHDGPWQRWTLAAGTKPLAGVALTGLESGFAVGADGTVLRLWRPPDPAAHQAALDEAERQRLAEEARLAEEERLYNERIAAEQAAAEQAAAEQAAAEQAAAEQAAAEQAAAEQQAEPTAETSSPPPPPPVEQDDIRMNGVVIDDSEPSGTRTGQRLLKNVRAVRRGQKLIVSFRLTAKARVGLTAKRGRRVIAKTRMRTLRRGRRQLVLRFSGRPPSSLKVVVRRVSGATDNR